MRVTGEQQNNGVDTTAPKIQELLHSLKTTTQRLERLRKSKMEQFKKLKILRSKKNMAFAAQNHVKNNVSPLFFLLVLSQLTNGK